MIDYRTTYRMLEQALAGIEKSAERTAGLSGILEALVEGPGGGGGVPLGIGGARLYVHDADRRELRLVASAGRSIDVEPGFTVPTSYPPIRRLFDDGFVLMDEDDPEFDARIEGQIGVERFAAIAIGREPTHVIAFTLGHGLDADQAVYLLGTVRHIVNLRIEQGHMISDLEEARRIQTTLLPHRPPSFWDFDISARSVPAERVGGDFFDYVPLSEKNLGIAIGDSSGHGLPAALMARDVVTALRVVLDIHYRMTWAVERVNRIVARSALASRFISLFYAELEPSGNLVYCNAGHPPPLLARGGRVEQLRRGGLVLGPDPDAAYERGFRNFPDGTTLLAYTDGITESLGPDGKEFGVRRLARLLSESKGLTSAGLVARVFDEIEAFSPGSPHDDRTVLVVRRSRVSAPSPGP